MNYLIERGRVTFHVLSGPPARQVRSQRGHQDGDQPYTQITVFLWKYFSFIFHQYTSWKMLYLVFVIKNCRFHVFSKSSPIKLGFLSSMKAYYISVRNVWYWYWPKNKKHFVYNVYTYVFWRGLWTMLQEAMREKYSSVKQKSNRRAILSS